MMTLSLLVLIAALCYYVWTLKEKLDTTMKANAAMANVIADLKQQVDNPIVETLHNGELSERIGRMAERMESQEQE